MGHSIHSRIIISAFIVLLLFMSLTGAALDKAFRTNAEKSQQDNLRTQVYALLANAELNLDNKLSLPKETTEPRLNIIDSDLHARVITPGNNITWQSISIFNKKIPVPVNIEAGKFYFSSVTDKKDNYTAVNFSTLWVTEPGEKNYIFQVVENRKTLNAQIALFRKNLWGWLAGISFALIIVQVLILRWGLEPLRQVAKDVQRIEHGKATKLKSDYVKEIKPLTTNINQLLDSSQQQLKRYRDALGNMAHSLKTPIAVLHGMVTYLPEENKNTADEQLETINNIIEYQLQRAATAGKTQFTSTTALLPVAEKIINALQKVHRDKNIKINLNIDPAFTIKIEEGDLYELLGNVIENAFKWTKENITISAKQINGQSEIIVEDDGPGIKQETINRILQRGQRADENIPGHGLGLAMVNDMLILYEGKLEIKPAQPVGAKLVLTL